MSNIILPSITVLPVGTKVKVGDINATIVAVGIYANNSVQYKIAYWSGYDRKQEYVESFEIEGEKPSLKIGFTE